MIIKQQQWTLGITNCESSHYTANQRTEDLQYYFSIGYYYNNIFFNLS